MRRDRTIPNEAKVVSFLEKQVPPIVAEKLAEHAILMDSIDPCSETYTPTEIQTIINTVNDLISILQQVGILTMPPPPSY